MEGYVARPVVIPGAGRHGRNAADIFRWMERLAFLDETVAHGTRADRRGCACDSESQQDLR